MKIKITTIRGEEGRLRRLIQAIRSVEPAMIRKTSTAHQPYTHDYLSDKKHCAPDQKGV